MDPMHAELGELECCPQCAGRLAEVLDAAGMEDRAPAAHRREDDLDADCDRL
ncbi:hypothetical protein [Marilutibacter spongiae]|uniref:Uncharacterized protein n=1 Tax=Marilutibacter spongiae TaxID=2025720 RepID=A0A7W3TM18_9GAMM|nr:hypothetical protein [Lysobacter spongiae]MBB1060822.1 hypothetical protein [Lysobacter spongiae]